jgi:hypothetical protein
MGGARRLSIAAPNEVISHLRDLAEGGPDMWPNVFVPMGVSFPRTE